MKSLVAWIMCCAVLGFTASTRAAEDSLDPNLEALRPLLGTWRGEFKKSTPEKPLIDVLKFERALNGKAIRSLHSINEGMYGGETIFTWDAEKKTIVYHYFTTAGFMTTGTMKVDGKKFVTNEKVSGRGGGVTEVNGTAELKEDGSFQVKTEHVKDGTPTPGHEVTYKRAADAKVVFK